MNFIFVSFVAFSVLQLVIVMSTSPKTCEDILPTNVSGLHLGKVQQRNENKVIIDVNLALWLESIFQGSTEGKLCFIGKYYKISNS